ncbi:MAG: Ig-like domain-containing protein [Erysipelotrichaceae bacterium]|jgi:hypothetical protein|nr:Ig-like domain-containing protein [Erysipelotrichaceae bacterium]
MKKRLLLTTGLLLVGLLFGCGGGEDDFCTLNPDLPECAEELEAPTSITISGATTVEVNATISLTADVLPAGASQSVSWTSDKNDVATVSNGVVRGMSAGTAIIRATSTVDTTISATHSVVVTGDGVVVPTSISISGPTSVAVGSSIQLSTQVLPAGNWAIDWTSSGAGSVSIAQGTVTGMTAGAVTVTAAVVGYPEVKADYAVTVTTSSVDPSDYYIIGSGSFVTGTPWTTASGVPMQENPNPDRVSFPTLVAEYMVLSISMSQGDEWSISNGTATISTEGFETGTGNALTANQMHLAADNKVVVDATGVFSVYFKTWEDGGTSTWIAADPNIIGPTPDAVWYVVGSFSNWADNLALAHAMAVNPSYVGAGIEYFVTNISFQAGDQFKLYSPVGTGRWITSGWETDAGSAFAAGLIELVSDGYGGNNVGVISACSLNIYFKDGPNGPDTYSCWIEPVTV